MKKNDGDIATGGRILNYSIYLFLVSEFIHFDGE